jgi:hypothetical protein
MSEKKNDVNLLSTKEGAPEIYWGFFLFHVTALECLCVAKRRLRKKERANPTHADMAAGNPSRDAR